MSVQVDATSLKKLQAQMKAAPREVRAGYRAGLKDIGNEIRDDAKARIESKSPETAAELKTRTQMPATVIVQGGSKDRPIGKLLEGTDGHQGYWSHPLFGDEAHKYPEKRFPHLYPAFAARRDKAADKLKQHVVGALNRIDLKASDE